MMGLRPIPRRMLPDAMEVLVAGGCAARIGHVRLVEKCVVEADAYGQRPRRTGTVYVDALRSEGAFEVPVGSCVFVRGRRYQVEGCRAFEAMNGNVHHWELDVVSVAEEAE